MAAINIVIGTVAAVGAATLGYWVQDRTPPIHDLKVEVLEPAVPLGGLIRIRNTFVRDRMCHLKLQQFVFDVENTRISAPLEEFLIAPGQLGQESVVTIMSIPTALKPGRARYRAIRAYYCNWLHVFADWPILVIGPDILFEISDRTVPSPSHAPRPDYGDGSIAR